MDGPLVSVIVPSYDRAVFLKRRSLPSVLQQTYENWELIVVGDGVPDGSLRDAVMGFRDPRMRYEEIARPDYSGLSPDARWHVAGAAARNRGLQLARGDIVAPLDDDDEFLPNHLADSVEALWSGAADVVYGFALIRDMETGRDRGENWHSWTDPATRRLFETRNILFHSTVAYVRRFARVQYPNDGRLPADYGLWLALYKDGARFASIDRPQAIYYGESARKPLRVSVPSLPPLESFTPHVTRIFEDRTLSNTGPICIELETRIGERLGIPRPLALPSGDCGLMVAFRVLRDRIAEGRRDVVLPSYAHPSLVNAALWNGFDPVFCDVDPETLCVSPETVAAAMPNRCAAIAAHHAHGNPCDMPRLECLSRDRHVALIADAAAAFGAWVGGRPVGTWGQIEIFSLSATKALTAGEGGLMCSRSEDLLEHARRVARYGIDGAHSVDSLGMNGKIAELPAALALASLPHVDLWLARRRRAEARYRNQLAFVPRLRLPRATTGDAVSGCKDAVLILDSVTDAQRLRDRLAAHGVDSRPYYRPLHLMPAYSGLRRAELRTTERLADCTLCVPLYNDIRDEVVDLVSHIVRDTLV